MREMRRYAECNGVLEIVVTEQAGKPWEIMPLTENGLKSACKERLHAIAVKLRNEYELSDD